jgi:hypothetical protein
MNGPLKPLLESVGPGLGKLLERAAAVDELTAVVRDRLPVEWRAQLQAAVVHGDELVLVTGSAAWATRLRYAAPGLLLELQGLPPGRGLQRVRVKVRGA